MTADGTFVGCFYSPLLCNGLGSKMLDPGDHRVGETVWDLSILATLINLSSLKVGNAFQLDCFPTTPPCQGQFLGGIK